MNIKINQKQKNAVQYFSFKVLQKVDLDCGVRDYYLKKYENKIGIIHEGRDYFFMNYLENNEEVSSMLFEYETEDSSDEKNSSSYFDRHLEYCFCGKLEYLFYNQLAGKIIQCNLKNLNCKTYHFEKRTLNLIKATKNTNLIILNWICRADYESLIEIRESEDLQIKYMFKYQHGIPQMVEIQESQILIIAYKQKINSIQYFKIRVDKFKCILSFYRKNDSQIIDVDNNLIFENNYNKNCSKFVSLILKGKILRKLLFGHTESQCSLKKYNNCYLLKVKSQNWVSYQVYRWWIGDLVYSNIIKDILNGKITSREAKEMVYILIYKADVVIDKGLEPQIPGFQSPKRPYLDRYSIY